jgi:hypothetical protein
MRAAGQVTELPEIPVGAGDRSPYAVGETLDPRRPHGTEPGPSLTLQPDVDGAVVWANDFLSRFHAAS